MLLQEPLKLVVVGGQVKMQQCALYTTHHHPMTESHHVCPESWWVKAGKPVASPLMQLCPNCHYGIHVCIDGIFRGHDISLMPKRWISIAKQAFVIATQNGLTPAPTL